MESIISALIGNSPYVGLFSLLILGTLGFPFPEDATLILCGFLISAGTANPVPALLVIYAGLLITDFGLYSVGKKYGRRIVTHRRFSKIITAERIAVLEDRFRKIGVVVILTGRHLIGLRSQIFLGAGIMKMPAVKFLLADAVSSLFTISLMVGGGYAGGYSLDIIRKHVTRIEHLAGIILAVLLVAVYGISRYVKARQKATG